MTDVYRRVEQTYNGKCRHEILTVLYIGGGCAPLTSDTDGARFVRKCLMIWTVTIVKAGKWVQYNDVNMSSLTPY